ncbi:MAG TPA: hypothetical protein VIU61_13320 [Kofleriaceae bacterium]
MRLVLALGLGFVLAPSITAHADRKVEKADQLFREGLALKDSNVTQACAKFEESLRYNAQAIGTLLNVALCDEKLGRIASAARKYREARDRSREQGLPEHLAAAEERLAAVEPELPHVTITFTEPPTADTRILIDDQLLPLDEVLRHPVDPGDRVIVVTAPGHVAFKTSIRLRKRQHEEVIVPVLAKSIVSSRRTLGKIITASGGLAVATGITLGILANSRYNSADCVDGVCATNEDHLKTESARTLGTAGTIVGIVGIAAVAAGTYVWLRSPRAPADSARVSVVPQLGPDGGGILAIGRF